MHETIWYNLAQWIAIGAFTGLAGGKLISRLRTADGA